MQPGIETLRARLRSEGRLALSLHVIAKSPKTAWAGAMSDGTLKLRVAAPPERGKANAELLRFLAAEFALPARSITILSGATSPHKLIRLVRA